jgi:hypothetical protein
LERRASATTGDSLDKSAPEAPHGALALSIEAYYVGFLVEKLKIGVVGDGYALSILRRGCS